MISEDFVTDSPRVSRGNKDRWIVDWDRSAEAEKIVAFMLNGSAAQICVLNGAGNSAATQIVNKVAKSLNKKIISTQLGYSDDNYICVAVAAHFMRTYRVAPVGILSYILRYTSGSAVYDHASFGVLRTISNYVHAQRRAGAPTTLRIALKRFGMRPSYDASDLDELIDEAYVRSKIGVERLNVVFSQDLYFSREFMEYTGTIIVQVHQSVDPSESFWSHFLKNFGIGKIIYQNVNVSRSVIASAYYSESSPHYMRIDVPGFDISGIRDFIEPALSALGLLERSAAADSVEKNITKSIRSGTVLIEESLQNGLDALSQLESVGSSQEALKSKSAPLDAEVVGGVLRLVGSEVPNANVAIEQLEAVIEAHREDVSRLRRSLAGSNAGDGFLSRLESLDRRMAEKLTHASSLIVATQVRGLEAMLPALREVLTDLTAADVGATISGLGLFVRQFPSWSNFVQSAADADRLTEEELEDLNAIVENILSQDSSIVDEELKEGVRDVQQSGAQASDVILQRGLAGGISNIYKGVGRYLRGFPGRFGSQYAENFEKKLAGSAVNLTYGALILPVAEALVRLSSGLPNEFGWALGLIIWNSVTKVVD